jgi:hypothetical protein
LGNVKSPIQSLQEQLEEALENPPATVEDVWDIMTIRGGQQTTSLDVDDVMYSFEGCRRVGLDMQLQSIAPLDKYSAVTPEELSCGEVAHLCIMTTQSRDVTEAQARDKLELVKEECRSLSGMREIRSMIAYAYGRQDRGMSLMAFSRFIHILTALLQIEETSILNVIVWVELGWLELSDTLTKLIVETCAKRHQRHAQEDPDALWKSLNASLMVRPASSEAETRAKSPGPDSGSLRFSLNDWVRLVRNCGIKMHQEVITSIYAHTIHRAQTEAHVRPKRKVDSHGSASDHARVPHLEELRPLQGRWELERLMEELWKHDSMRKQYLSPLAMVTALIIKAEKDPQLGPHHSD